MVELHLPAALFNRCERQNIALEPSANQASVGRGMKGNEVASLGGFNYIIISRCTVLSSLLSYARNHDDRVCQ
jgi:hypothetical protein